MQHVKIKEDNISELNTTEVRSIIDKISSEDENKVFEELKRVNDKLDSKITLNNKKIKQEIEICEILLKRLWRCLEEKNKKELAPFFKKTIAEIKK